MRIMERERRGFNWDYALGISQPMKYDRMTGSELVRGRNCSEGVLDARRAKTPSKQFLRRWIYISIS